ncbi:GTP-binding protein [Lentzea sp. NPDC042327]|uniref:sulfate adenylyltransferase subunit 1 n=1 Tax=Lentzea sp. NPDC042327 TaxID=3154801 RepID=UPI0033C70977
MPGLLRVATAGSVDDGKSTLIGRLLHDSKAVLADQLQAVTSASRRRGYAETDLALLVDGLRAEREQGITIDVAYRYFATPKRSFVLADTPGHVQYTRNMVTGASTADVAVVLVDARTGLTEQSRRHTAIAGLLGIRHVVLAVNKMDLAGYREDVFDEVVAEFARVCDSSWTAIPISALRGDNVVTPSDETPWYGGVPLLAHLEDLVLPPAPSPGGRFAVQLVIRPRTPEHRDFRGYGGRVASGTLHVGDPVVVQPGGWQTTITAIDTYDGPLSCATTGQSVVVSIADDLDAGRGAMISTGTPGTVTSAVAATVCWMTGTPLEPGARYVVRHTTSESRAVVEAVESRLNVSTFGSEPAESLALNDIGTIRLRFADPLVADRYRDSRATGGFVLVEEGSGGTAAVGLIEAV